MPLETAEKRTLVALVLCTLVTGGFVLARMLAVGSKGYAFLGWNLFLAWVPLLAALALTRLTHKHWAAFAAVGLAWLGFFPNAPYIVTDFLHLRTTRGAPLWLDVLVVASAAATGMLLALVSLTWVHAALDRRFARPRLTWLVVLAICAATAFGVYLGRFQRWNTWDILTKPDELLADAWALLAEPRVMAFVPLFALALVASYVVFRLLTRPTPT